MADRLSSASPAGTVVRWWSTVALLAAVTACSGSGETESPAGPSTTQAQPTTPPSTEAATTTLATSTTVLSSPAWEAHDVGAGRYVAGFLGTDAGLQAVVTDDSGSVHLVELGGRSPGQVPESMVVAAGEVVSVVTADDIRSDHVDTQGGYIAAATAFGEMVVGVGQTSTEDVEFGPGVWVKDRGGWARVDVPASTGIFDLTAVAASPERLVATARMNEQEPGRLLWSNDAFTWQEATLPLRDATSLPFLLGIVWVEHRFVVMAHDAYHGGILMWTSPDGTNWTWGDSPDEVFGDGTTYLSPIATTLNGSGAGMAGEAVFRDHPAFCYADHSRCRLKMPAMWLLDAAGWTRLEGPPSASGDLGVVGTDGNMVAVSDGAADKIWVSPFPPERLAVPPVDTDIPDIGLPMVESGASLEPGIEYAFPLHMCIGWDQLGTFNDVYWIGEERADHPADLIVVGDYSMEPPHVVAYGKLELVAPDHIVYSDMAGTPVADYTPAPPDYSPYSCF